MTHTVTEDPVYLWCRRGGSLAPARCCWAESGNRATPAPWWRRRAAASRSHTAWTPRSMWDSAPASRRSNFLTRPRRSSGNCSKNADGIVPVSGVVYVSVSQLVVDIEKISIEMLSIYFAGHTTQFKIIHLLDMTDSGLALLFLWNKFVPRLHNKAPRLPPVENHCIRTNQTPALVPVVSQQRLPVWAWALPDGDDLSLSPLDVPAAVDSRWVV